MTSQLKLASLSSGLVLIGLLFVVVVLIDRLNSKKPPSVPVTMSSIIERDAGIERARQGTGEYSFSTNFIPGIGQFSDAEGWKQNFTEQNPGAVTN